MKWIVYLAYLFIFPNVANAWNIGGALSSAGYGMQGAQEAAEKEQELRASQQQNEMAAIQLRKMQRQEKQEQNQRALDQTAIQISQSCPKMLDNITRLDGAISASNKLTYIYTILNTNSDQFTPDIKAKMANNARQFACTQPWTSQALKVGIVIGYAYRDKNGIDSLQVTIYPRDCM